jgi:hypothetical protein
MIVKFRVLFLIAYADTTLGIFLVAAALKCCRCFEILALL